MITLASIQEIESPLKNRIMMRVGIIWSEELYEACGCGITLEEAARFATQNVLKVAGIDLNVLQAIRYATGQGAWSFYETFPARLKTASLRYYLAGKAVRTTNQAALKEFAIAETVLEVASNFIQEEEDARRKKPTTRRRQAAAKRRVKRRMVTQR